MSAGSKLRKGSDVAAASAAVQRRGWQIFGLAFLFRLQAYLLSPGSHLMGLLKVDILNIMGPAIVVAALMWAWGRTTSSRFAIYAVAAGLVAVVTPFARSAEWLALVPDPVEAYVRPVPNLNNFTVFPWAGFLFAGAAAGTLIDAARTPAKEMRVNLGLALTGALLSVAGYVASLGPMVFANTNFWTTSPTFFAMRAGIISAAIALAYFWERRFGSDTTHALQVLGRASLFVYWIHVEMVYGLLASAIRHQLALPVVCTAYFAFMFMLYVIVRLKNAMTQGRGAITMRESVNLRI